MKTEHTPGPWINTPMQDTVWALVAFGMIPKWIIDMAEGMIREKIVREAARQVGCTPEELTPIVDKKVVDDMTAKIIKAVCVAIYKTASERGKMIV